MIDVLLGELVDELNAWCAVVLVPNAARDALICHTHYKLPEDWAALDNRLDSGSMNAGVYLSQKEAIENDIDIDLPPTDIEVSRHRITAAASVPMPNLGTLEVLANTDGYLFGEPEMQRIRSTAEQVAKALS